MKMSKLALDLEDLNVDTFTTSSEPTRMMQQSVIVYTVLQHTEAISCGGSCATCDTGCWA